MHRNFSNQEIVVDSTKKSIFLAGPTRRNSPFSNSWRKEACDYLEERGFDGIVYIPEFDEGNNYDYVTQATWERNGLVNATKLLFYIPRHLPDMPGFTTHVEFGMYLARRKDDVVFCSPKDAEKNRYLKWLYYEEKGVGSIVYEDLHSALDGILKSMQ